MLSSYFTRKSSGDQDHSYHLASSLQLGALSIIPGQPNLPEGYTHEKPTTCRPVNDNLWATVTLTPLARSAISIIHAIHWDLYKDQLEVTVNDGGKAAYFQFVNLQLIPSNSATAPIHTRFPDFWSTARNHLPHQSANMPHTLARDGHASLQTLERLAIEPQGSFPLAVSSADARRSWLQGDPTCIARTFRACRS